MPAAAQPRVDTAVSPEPWPEEPAARAALSAYGGGWRAHLSVGVERVAGRCVAARVSHVGPLRIQKVLWPEGPSLAHLILLHPPSGLAGGDSVEFDLALADDCRVLLTTPGAGRWYRADAPASQTVSVRVGAGGSLEWLPQETVLHDGVRGRSRMAVDVAANAAALGLDVLVLGRRASGEALTRGDFRSHLTLRRDGRLLLAEATRVGGAERGPAALGQGHVSGLLWAVSPQPMAPELAEAIEAALDESLGVDAVARDGGDGRAIGAASLVDPHLLLVRAVGSSPERIRAALMSAWVLLRPLLIGRAAQTPRIWMT